MEARELVPQHFQCPISLEIMTEPVILSTGITYDRKSIEKWLRSGHNTCPVTRQVLETNDVLPNLILQRFIQTWYLSSRSGFSSSISYPCPASSDDQVISKLLRDIDNGIMPITGLRSLRALALQGESNKEQISSPKALRVLASVLTVHGSEKNLRCAASSQMCSEALIVLCLLSLNYERKTIFIHSNAVDSLVRLLQIEADPDTLINAAQFLGDLSREENFRITIGAIGGAMEVLLNLLKKNLQPSITKQAAVTLHSLCSDAKNRILIIKLGVVEPLVALLSKAEGQVCEKSLALLELMLFCSEGREAIAKLPDAMPTIVSKITEAAQLATGYAVGALSAICKYSSRQTSVCNEAMRCGALSRLLLLLNQATCRGRTRQKAVELLKLLSRVCKRPTHVYWEGNKALLRV